MTATDMIKPEDRYDSDRIAEFRANGHWRGGSLAERLEHWSRERGEKTAVSDGYGELTWSALHGQAYRLAARLREMDIEPGDRVHVQLPSWNEFVVIYVALARIGAVLVPSMPIYRWDEVRHAINHAGAKVSFICGEYRKFDYHQMINDIRPDCETLRHVVTVRTDPDGEGESSFADLVSGDGIPDDSALGPVPDADDPHAIIYTSGTESRPKGCFHTFNTFGYTVYSLGDDVMSLNPDDVMFMPSPVTHATGLAMGVTTPIVLGCGMHLMDSWEPKAALERIREHGCTASMAATPFVRMVLDNYDPESHDLSSLRVWVSAGAPIPAALLSEWKPKFPDCVLLPVYGRSEGLLVTSCRLDDPGEKILGSDGRALPGVDLRIQDEEGNQVAAGEEGEICHGGPGLMLGYWRDPDRTAQAIEPNGVSHSGDLGRVDEDGYLRVTGRIKDLIIRGGTNISAQEVEEHLVSHPKVANAAVVGVPDDRLGERACAFVVPASPDDPPSLEELTGYLKDERKIAVVKLPERLEVIDELPMTATGKVQKFVLRDKVAPKD
ncbi:MAG TPA: AMP-binding protein [Pseudonocardia sp.]|uniref:AMP-binding protein n=1 Tax=Pseudonocardia sp. TaxID=60912 RepID=UPI002F3EC68F